MEAYKIKNIVSYHVHEVANGASLIGNSVSIIINKLKGLDLSREDIDYIEDRLNVIKRGNKRVNDSLDHMYKELSVIWRN